MTCYHINKYGLYIQFQLNVERSTIIINEKKMSFHNIIRYKSRHVSQLQAPVAQWIGHPPPKREIPGSSPGGSVLK